MEKTSYDDDFVRDLFDRMGPTYDVVNTVSSFGFSSRWRRQCVRNAGSLEGLRVCDLMAGAGECWSYILRPGVSLVSVDFSRFMTERQEKRNHRLGRMVDVRCENALSTSIESGSIDVIISVFGLKTLSPESMKRLALETHRLLKPGGRISLLEISTADGWWLSAIYRWYLRSIIPIVGKICLGDIECYRMLSAYTENFGSCRAVAPAFSQAGFEVSVRDHFFGCATSIVGRKSG